MEALPKKQQIEQFSTTEEISEAFDKTQISVFCYEETGSDQGVLSYVECYELLKRLEHSIINQGMFSPNEDFKEIHTENLKYLQLPFLIAETTNRMMTNRKENIQMAKKYYNEYLKLISHFKQLQPELKKLWQNYMKNPKFRPMRNDKIAEYKASKLLKTKIQNLKKIKDEDHQREVSILALRINCHTSIKQIAMIPQEIMMLEYKEKLEKDEKFKEQEKRKNEKPIPKLKWFNIPKPQMINQPYLVGDSMKQQQQHLCNNCEGQVKKQILDQVFKQPLAFTPTHTLDSLVEENMQMMEEQQIVQTQIQKEKEEEALIDSDLDEEKDAKNKKKEREWDDWKDEHPTGSGNLNGR